MDLHDKLELLEEWAAKNATSATGKVDETGTAAELLLSLFAGDLIGYSPEGK